MSNLFVVILALYRVKCIFISGICSKNNLYQNEDCFNVILSNGILYSTLKGSE